MLDTLLGITFKFNSYLATIFKGERHKIYIFVIILWYFIEVKNIQEDDLDYTLGMNIADILNSKGYSFMVVISSSVSMATPTYFYKTREEKEEYLQSVLTEFNENLENIGIISPPLVINDEEIDYLVGPAFFLGGVGCLDRQDGRQHQTKNDIKPI